MSHAIKNLQVNSENKDMEKIFLEDNNNISSDKGEAPISRDNVIVENNEELVVVEVEQKNNLTIMEITKPVQTDKSLMVHSPN